MGKREKVLNYSQLLEGWVSLSTWLAIWSKVSPSGIGINWILMCQCKVVRWEGKVCGPKWHLYIDWYYRSVLKAEIKNLWEAHVWIFVEILGRQTALEENAQGILSLFMQEDPHVCRPLFWDVRLLGSMFSRFTIQHTWSESNKCTDYSASKGTKVGSKVVWWDSCFLWLLNLAAWDVSVRDLELLISCISVKKKRSLIKVFKYMAWRSHIKLFLI